MNMKHFLTFTLLSLLINNAYAGIPTRYNCSYDQNIKVTIDLFDLEYGLANLDWPYVKGFPKTVLNMAIANDDIVFFSENHATEIILKNVDFDFEEEQTLNGQARFRNLGIRYMSWKPIVCKSK